MEETSGQSIRVMLRKHIVMSQYLQKACAAQLNSCENEENWWKNDQKALNQVWLSHTLSKQMVNDLVQ